MSPFSLPRSEWMVLTPQQAFLAMIEYVWQFSTHGGLDFIQMMSDISIESDGGPRDPAAWSDWLNSVGCVKALPRGGGDRGKHEHGMRAVIRRFHSPDLHDLDRDVPADPRRFAILVQVMVGPDDGPGEESFDVTVCTPQWVSDEAARRGVVHLRDHVVVDRWDWPVIRARLTAIFGQATGDDWDGIATGLSRWGRWEFE